jgi:pyruvate,water dikinase
VTTKAYEEFVRSNGLGRVITNAAQEFNYNDLDELEHQTERIREMVVHGVIPGMLERQIRSAYAALGVDARVAVRSSGTAEDLADASFAGQYEKVLNVRGFD